MNHPFTDSELTTIFELAFHAIRDFDVLEELDLADGAVDELTNHLHDYLNPKEKWYTRSSVSYDHIFVCYK